jgi:hypothetical protein
MARLPNWLRILLFGLALALVAFFAAKVEGCFLVSQTVICHALSGE